MQVNINRDFIFTQADFERIRQQLAELTGISLSDSKDSMVYGRLSRRLRELKLSSFAEYIDFLRSSPTEVEHFINALTTNLTSFFRESHHFELLAEYLSREVQGNSRTCTIWCAACSTGEEAYSIAMTVVETFGSYQPSIRIIASDIDSKVIEVARRGVYPIKHLDKMSKERKKQFFFKGAGSQTGKVKVVPQLKKLVEFKQLNLLDNQWAIPNDLDIVFCRNVMIYFDKETQVTLVKKMSEKLRSNGLYFAGHSENLSHLPDLVKSIGKTVYQAVDG